MASTTDRCIATCLGLLALLSTFGLRAEEWPGLPTRDQNPLLQGYLIPAQAITGSADGWSGGASIYITNTYQQDHSAAQQLVIDVENTRLDLQLNYRQNDWILSANLPLIDNRAGQLDRLILDWHDFFGLPQGGRDQAPLDRLLMYWQVDGQDRFRIEQPVSGIGDLQLAAGYRLSPQSELWFALEMPSGSDPLLSNGGIDAALWWRYHGDPVHPLQTYGSAGLSWLHDGGVLKGHREPIIGFLQAGLRYRWNPAVEGLLQIDAHSSIADDSRVDALDTSLQGQFGLRFPQLIDGYQLNVFFSEDILPGHAPDITFALSLSPIETL